MITTEHSIVGRRDRGKGIKCGPAGKAGGGFNQEEEGDPGWESSVTMKGVVRGGVWSSFAGGKGLCEAEMLRVCPAWPLSLVEVRAGTKGLTGALATAVFIYCNSA